MLQSDKRAAAIEAAAKRAYIEYQEDGPAFSIAREDAELWTVLAENIIDAYERALAEQPREEREALGCSYCGGTMRRGKSYFCDCGAVLGHRCEQPEDGMKTKRDWSL